VRGAKAVEEVQERHPALETGHEGKRGHVLGFLDRRAGEDRETCRPSRIYVGVVAEDGERVPGDGSGRDVEDARLQLAGDLEHLGQHQQQALARSERRRQCTPLQSAVNGPRGPGLRLHLDDLRHLPPQVPAARGRPGVGQLSHRTGRRDRVDRDHLGKLVGDARGGLVAIDDERLRPGLRLHA
jgi:hypothetical protein